MQIDFSKLINLSYLLDPNPPFQFAAFWPLLFVYGGVVLLALLLPLFPWKPWQHGLKERLSTPLWVLSLGGLALLFFRNQSIPYLSVRLVHILFLLALLFWIGYSLSVARREVAKAKAEHEHSKRLERYLPKKKRR